MGTVIRSTITGTYHAIFRPSRLVSTSNQLDNQSIIGTIRQSWHLFTIYSVNLVLYAGPLTLAGIGIGTDHSLPGWLQVVVGPRPTGFTLLLAGFVENSLYLFGVTVATLVAIHLALLVTFQSKGFVRTAYSIVYSTSVYLAGLFTIVWYLTTASGVGRAREFVLNVQVEFIYTIIDATGSDIVFGIERPLQVIPPGGFSTVGAAALITLLTVFLYYLYSLYLGVRLNHGAGRFESALVVLVVLALPVIYIVGSIAITNIHGVTI